MTFSKTFPVELLREYNFSSYRRNALLRRLLHTRCYQCFFNISPQEPKVSESLSRSTTLIDPTSSHTNRSIIYSVVALVILVVASLLYEAKRRRRRKRKGILKFVLTMRISKKQSLLEPLCYTRLNLKLNQVHGELMSCSKLG